MAMLTTERPPVRRLTCPDCGHDLYPLHAAVAEHPTWERSSRHCRVAVTDASGSTPRICRCEAAPHQEA